MFHSDLRGFTGLVSELAQFRAHQDEVLKAERAENAEIIAEVEGDGRAMKSLRGLADDMATFAMTQRSDSEARRARELAQAEAERAQELAEARRRLPDLIALANELAGSGRQTAEQGARLDIRSAAAANELREP